ncbi:MULTISPECIES: glutathione peroxidase [Sphingobacterium]|uniref:Glutathione peroxidase n=1 Tax=Sphingobacterium tenebrionis TaxID=3111775 RepID=A0ABU8I3J4_9SPHI|nr:glutathione peroxidase [Sphingobacterium sp. CZ-2]QBR12024.1 glutathione peroxidase [Sphingobacterium sp. CZ-2]
MIYSILMVFTMLFNQPTVYDYSFKTLDGKKVSLSEFKGKQILIVNTASKCGFTKQYKELQELSDKYGKDLVVIGFPSDNFKGQEFDSNEEIAAFCEENYGVKFLLSEKVDVTGEKMIPLFKYLTTAKNPDFTGAINWNFEKFLIGKDGKLAHRYRSKVTPLDESIVKELK